METIGVLSHRIDSLAEKNTWNSGRIKELEVEMRNKVSYKIFWTLFSLLITILITILGYLVAITTKTQTDVATISGKLEPYDIEFTK